MTDTPSWDAAERAALLERATKLATVNGLTLPEGAVDKLDASGVSIFFHHHQSDAEVLTRLQAICKPAQTPEALASPHAATTHDPAFLVWLGPLATGFDTMPAVRRMQLARDFASGARTNTTPAPTGVDTSKMTPQQKLDYAHASNQTAKSARVAPVAETPAMAGLSGAGKLAHLDHVREAQRISRELQGLKASTGGGFNVVSTRAAAIERLETKLAAFADRGVIVA